MELNELMAGLAERLGVEGGFTPGSDGVYAVDADDLTVSFMEIEEHSSILIWSELCDLPSPGGERFLTALMRENFMGRGTSGGAFSLSDNDNVCLHRVLSTRDLDNDQFQKAVEDFMLLALNWQMLNERYRDGLDEEAPPKESESAQDPGLNGGFLRI